MTDYIFYFVLFQIALAVPIFYCYRFVLRKLGVQRINVYSVICTILFSLLFIWLFVIIDSHYIYPWIRSEKFDSHKWKTENKNRYQMVADLVENKQLIGKERDEVIDLLGKDIEEGPCSDCIGYSTNETTQGFSLDHEVLEIKFDDQDKVISVRINAW